MVEDKKYYNVKAVPFEAVREMSCSPRILWNRHGEVYFAELPLMYHEPGNINDNLYYIYNELTAEEKKEVEDKAVEVTVTVPGVIKIYDEQEKKKGRR